MNDDSVSPISGSSLKSLPCAQGDSLPQNTKLCALQATSRRRWMMAFVLGLVFAVAAALPAWYFITDKYTSVALLQISANEQQLVFQTVNRALASNFEIFKSTQQELITSDVVLVAALRKDEAAKIPVIQNEDDPVRWLAKNIRIDYPGNAEVMRVSLTCAKPEDAATLVGAVVDAYMSEAVDAERRRQRDRLNDLDHIFTEKETELRSLRTELKQLAEQLGTGDSGALALKQQTALQTYNEARRELIRIRQALQQAKDDLQIKDLLHKATKDSLRQDAKATTSSQQDSTQLIEQVKETEARLATLRQTVTDSKLKESLAELLTMQKAVEGKLAELREKQAAKQLEMNADLPIVELKARIEILTKQEIEAAKDLEKQLQKAELFGNSSIDVDMLRGELQYKEKILAPIAEEREKLKVELRTVPRITVFQKAESPKSPDGGYRIQCMAMAGFGGFFGIYLLVLCRNARERTLLSLVGVALLVGALVIAGLTAEIILLVLGGIAILFAFVRACLRF